jgi:UDP-N-acetylglucosamine 4-epimerase
MTFIPTAELKHSSFLITGGAGFIGSNIVGYLLKNNAGKVRVLDNLATGSIDNISEFINKSNFEFIEGDIRNAADCTSACEGIDYVSHQAALGSVPRSIKDPLTTHEVNATGFLNMLIAARDAKVKRFVYASSSAVYGDHPGLPKKEELTGNPLSPYAASKVTNELYAHVFARTYKIEVIGLRYFNVFGPHQSPNAQYAAVIPLFMQSVIDNKPPFIDGDGEQSRDFTYIDNVVQANVLSMLTTNPEAINKVYNVAYGERISINQLFKTIAGLVGSNIKPIYRETRPGDVRDSLADISQAKKLLGYNPTIRIEEGLKLTLNWFEQSMKKSS